MSETTAEETTLTADVQAGPNPEGTTLPPDVQAPGPNPQGETFNADVQDPGLPPEEIDLETAHAGKRQAMDDAAQLSQLRAWAAEEEDPAPELDPGPVDPITVPKSTDTEEEGIWRSFVRNFSLVQLAGGVIEAGGEMVQTAADVIEFSESAADIFATDVLGLSEEQLERVRSLRGSERIVLEKIADGIRSLAPDEEERGSMIRGMSQFFTGFLVAPQFKAIQGFKGARLLVNGLRGAVADFTAMDPDDPRLADTIADIWESNDLTQLLEQSPDDTAMLGRAKNAVEGFILGGIIDAVGPAIKAVRGAATAIKGRLSKAAIEAGEEGLSEADRLFARVEGEVAVQRENLTAALGDPTLPLTNLTRESAEMFAKAGQAKDEIFINWSRIDSPDDVKQVMKEMTASFSTSINEARRGVRTWTQTKLSAQQLDAWEVLNSRGVAGTLNAEEVVAVRELWTQSAAHLEGLMRVVASGDASLSQKFAFEKQLTTHTAIQEQVIASRTEIARAQNAWRIPVGGTSDFANAFENLRPILEAKSKGSEELARRMVQLTDMGRLDAVDSMVHGSNWVKTKDAATQLYYASLLSGPHTHMRNIIGNLGMVAMSVLERKGASLLGQAIGKQNVPTGESSALLFGMVEGFREAFSLTKVGKEAFWSARKALKSGDPKKAREIAEEAGTDLGSFFQGLAADQGGFAAGKVPIQRVGALSAEKLGLEREGNFSRVADWMDTFSRIPGRALGLSDEIFQSIHIRGEVNAQAFRKATQELNAGQITRDQFLDRLTELKNNPTDAMEMMARSISEKNTFTNRPLDTSWFRAFDQMANARGFGILVLPFKGTPYNINVEAFSRTPLAPLVKQWQNDLKAGGAQADIAWTKMLTGTAALITAADLAMSGIITGRGPRNSSERSTLMRTGWRPFSVRVPTGVDDQGNETFRYFSYRGTEPISSSLQMAANAWDLISASDFDDDQIDTQNLWFASALGVAGQLTSAQYMSGLTSVLDALSNPTRYSESFFERLASPLVPTIVSHINRTANDDVLREINGMWEALAARTPGLSDDLPPRRDLWGREIALASGLGGIYDFLSPIYSKSTKDAQPIDRELNELEKWIPKPKKKTSFLGININLNKHPEIYDALVKLSGNEMTATTFGAPITTNGGFVSEGRGLMDELNAVVTGKHSYSAIYQTLSGGVDGGKGTALQRIVQAYQKAAKAHVLRDFPELRTMVDMKREKEAEASGQVFIPTL